MCARVRLSACVCVCAHIKTAQQRSFFFYMGSGLYFWLPIVTAEAYTVYPMSTF